VEHAMILTYDEKRIQEESEKEAIAEKFVMGKLSPEEKQALLAKIETEKSVSWCLRICCAIHRLGLQTRAVDGFEMIYEVMKTKNDG
jgi:hypothetical protein